ncbi:MAG TPA: glycosyltransferase family 2 protein [Bryobacteraceae bacterium]|jgi:glycosyltransferase involved in cell wall biosynthesis
MKPFVSVIVPCRNEAEFLPGCLDSILGSDYPSECMEVLIADGWSVDGTRQIVAQYAARDPRVRVVDNARGITPAGLNLAIRQARGDVIVRLDGHSTVAPDYLTQAVDQLEATGAANVGGTMLTLTRDRGPFAEPICVALTSPFGVGNSRFRTGVKVLSPVDTVFGGCWRREVFARVGYFNERLERGQDIEFNLRLRRAGGTILLAPGMQSRYYARAALKTFCRSNWNNGVWALLPFAYTRGMPVRWRHLVPLAFFAALAGSVAAALLRPELGTWALALVAGPYLAVNAAVSLAAAWRKRRFTLALLLPVTFACLHLSYGAGSLWGVLRLLCELPLARLRLRHNPA